jgi:hypothetical protein
LAAVAALLCASDAFAIPSSSTSGHPGLTLIVWDEAAKVTYFRDLGAAVEWTPGTVNTVFGQNLDFTADDNWGKFLTKLGGKLPATAVYDVVSGYSKGGVNVLLTTAPTDPNLGTLPNNTGLKNSATNWDTFSSYNYNSGTGDPNFNTGGQAGSHGSNVSVNGDLGEVTSSPNLPWQLGFAQSGFSTFATVGTGLDFYTIARNSVAVLPGTATLVPGGREWNLDAVTGELTYKVAAVPEPASVTLLVGGLLVAGTIVQRRSTSRRRPQERA